MAITLKKTNFAKSTLLSSILIGGSSVTLQAGAGALFPASGNFRAVFWGSAYSSPQDDSTREIVQATISAGDTFTITRAQEGTVAKAWSAGDNFALTITKGVFDDLETAINHRGALVKNTGGQTIPDGTWTQINWDTEIYDTDTIHDNITNPERLTVPSGVTKVRLTANICFENNATGDRGIRLLKNGSFFTGGHAQIVPAPAATIDSCLSIPSPVVLVIAGDYFTASVIQTSTAPLAIRSTDEKSWFAMEIVE